MSNIIQFPVEYSPNKPEWQVIHTPDEITEECSLCDQFTSLILSIRGYCVAHKEIPQCSEIINAIDHFRETVYLTNN